MDKETEKPARGKRRGFTLAELLIVVAILAVLVAVAIPTFSFQMEKVREAVDIDHLRQAKSAATVYFIENPPKGRISRKYYDVYSGELVEWVDETAVKAIPLYGKGTSAKGLGLWTENGMKYHESLDVRDCLIMATADREGNIYCGWVKPEYAIRADPFTFLATLTENGKEYLFPTRSKSQWNGGRPADLSLLEIDNDLKNIVNQLNNPGELEQLYYTLEMYYRENLRQLSEHNTIQDDSMLALRVELFYGIQVYGIDDTTHKDNYFFNKTIFQRRMCDAEAVTLAEQFWAKIAEYNDNNLSRFDSVSSATKPLGWKDGNNQLAHNPTTP